MHNLEREKEQERDREPRWGRERGTSWVRGEKSGLAKAIVGKNRRVRKRD